MNLAHEEVKRFHVQALAYERIRDLFLRGRTDLFRLRRIRMKLVRAERRCAMNSLLQLMVKHIQFGEALTVRRHRRGVLCTPRLKDLAKDADLRNKRTWRAARDLQAMGILRLTERRVETVDGIRSIAAVKEISEDFFDYLGLKKELDDACEHKRLQPLRPMTAEEKLTMALQAAGERNLARRRRDVQLRFDYRPPKPR